MTIMATVAEAIEPLIVKLLGEKPSLTIECWDGSTLGPSDTPSRVKILSPLALRRFLWAPNELGLARAYVAGDIEIEGDIFAVLSLRNLVASPSEDASLKFSAETSWDCWEPLASSVPWAHPPHRRKRRSGCAAGSTQWPEISRPSLITTTFPTTSIG